MTADRWLLLLVVVAGLVTTTMLSLRPDDLARELAAVEARPVICRLPPPVRRPVGDPA